MTVTASLLLGSEQVSGSTLGWSLVAAVLLILVNGFFVAYEFAIMAAKRSVFEAKAETGGRVAHAALASVSDLTMQLAGAQLGITIASLALGYVGEPAVASLLEGALGRVLSEEATRFVGFAVALTIVAFLHLVVGEMIPKNLAIAAPEATTSWLVLPYRAYLLAVRPFVLFLNWLANISCRLIGVEPRDELVASHSVSELASIVANAFEEGALEGESAELLHDALGFAQRPVSEVATPIADIATIRFGATPAQAERVIVTSGQTRLPIVAPARGQLRLVGYLHAKDLLRIEPSERFTPLPASFHRPMVLVRADRPVIDVLRMMRRLRRQLAVVIGDGEPIGVVSVEQIIRALVESDQKEGV